MPTVRYGEPLNVLVAAKGHPYLRDPFLAMFDELPGIADEHESGVRADCLE